MRLPFFPVALLLGAVGASAQPVTDFQLPPDPEATPDSEAEGPTDLEGDRLSSPRVIGSPTPTPRPTVVLPPRSAQTGTPSPAASPRSTQSTPPSPTASGRSLPASDSPVSTREMLGESGQQPRTASQPQGSAGNSSASGEANSARDTGTQPGTATPGADQAVEADALPSSDLSARDNEGTALRESGAAQSLASGGLPWLWLAGALAVLLALAGVIAMRLRRKTARPRPEPKPTSSDLSAAPLREATTRNNIAKSDPSAVADALEVEAHAVTLHRSVMNASISYRLILVNRGRHPITLIEVQGDITTAHGQIPADQQLADAKKVLPELHTLARLDAGQRTVMQGELRLPLREVRAIRQGSVPVFVPLLRLTVRAANLEPRGFTYVIGTRNPQKGSRPSPFRLDEPPRSYGQLTTRALA